MGAGVDGTDPAESGSAARSILLFLVVCAIMTGVASVAEKIAPQLPGQIWVAAAVIGSIAGVISAWVSYRAAPRAHRPRGGAAEETRSWASGGWLAATLVLCLVSFAAPPLFLVAIVTGLVAFRQRKAALGAALAILFTIFIGLVALLLFIGIELMAGY